MIAKPRQVAQFVARHVFQKRGNHSEAHIQEAELVAIIEVAIAHYDRMREAADKTQADLFAIKQSTTQSDAASDPQ